jgi:hypothetical protein
MFSCPKHLEIYRVQLPGYPIGDHQNGVLQIKPRGLGVIFSSGEGWEHVSVSRRARTPSYEDLEEIKQEFWSDDMCVMQLHVPASDHVNCHDHCLHLWRPTDQEIPRPPSIFVGPKR